MKNELPYKNIISQQMALDLLDDQNTIFVDGSWYLPSQGRNGKEEYQGSRIPGSVFFDIDAISDQKSELPHMLPTPAIFSEMVSELGIAESNNIVVYDGPGLFSAARVWWTFRVMGAQSVKILAGGFDKWRKNELPIETGKPQRRQKAVFEADFEKNWVIAIEALISNIGTKDAVVLDARPSERFYGKAPEPRPGMRSGHIPGSKSLPANEVVDNGMLLDPKAIAEKFDAMGIDADTKVVTSCGSGVTAAILTLALEETGRHEHQLFDGSWAQWGRPDGPEVTKDE